MALLRRILRTTARAALRWIDARCPSMAAAVAFFAAFSLAPTLVIVVAVGGAFFGPEAVRGQLVGELRGLIGEDGAVAVQSMILSAWLADRSGLKTLASVLTLLIGIGFLMVVSLVLDTAVRALQTAMWPPERVARVLMEVVNQASSLVLLTATFALLMKLMPTARVRWAEVALGAAVASVLFNLGRSLFGLYLARAGTADAFGAAGSLAVILMWLFYSAAVFLYGVAFARVWSE